MTDPAAEALRQRWIKAVGEDGEPGGVLAQEIAAGLTPASGGLDGTVPWVPAWTTRAVIATDTGRAWSVRVEAGVVTVGADRSGTEDAGLRAPTTELVLRLWGRPADVTVDGEPAAEALLRGR
jgi:hypothetical protein